MGAVLNIPDSASLHHRPHSQVRRLCRIQGHCQCQFLHHGTPSMSVTLPAVEKALKVYESLLEIPNVERAALTGEASERSE